MTTQYMCELEIDGVKRRQMVETLPTSVIVRFYRVDQTEDFTLLAEKVLK